ncbi:MAG TPA: chemotaxis protein CheW [Allocoleopsis sp.]
MYQTLIASQTNQIQKSLGDAYLRIQLDGQTNALLSMAHLQEVVVIPIDSITPIPLMPSCVRGLINRRNKVLWLVDLAQMLGFNPIDPVIQEYNVVIVRLEQFPLGLIVQYVKGVNRFAQDAIQSPLENVSMGVTPYLKGCILNNDQLLIVLDVKSILNSPLWPNNM